MSRFVGRFGGRFEGRLAGRFLGTVSSLALALLSDEARGLAFDFTDPSFFGSTGFYGSAAVKSQRETGDLVTTSTDFLTYTSPSVKMTMGSAGTYRYGAHNLCLQSETFGTTWAVSQATISSNATTAPDGTTTADKLQEDNNNNFHLVYQGSIALAATTYAVSVRAKAAERNFLQIHDDTSGTDYVNFNLGTGAVGNSTGYTGTITSLGDGWYLCTATRTFTAATHEFRFCVISTDAAARRPTYQGVAGSGIYLWGAHVRRTPSESTYLATTAAARYALPFEWNTSAVLQGILVEEARTNLALRSSDFSNASWSKADCAAAKDATGVTGVASSASTLTSNTANASHYAAQTITWTAAVYTVSVIAKYTNHPYVQITTWDGTTSKYANFNVQTGAAGSVSGVTASVTSLGGGFYRLTAVTTAAQAAAAGNVTIAFSDSSSAVANPTFDAAGTETVIVELVQVEAGAFATSPIETFGSTVTRAVDNISLSTNVFPFTLATSTAFVEFANGPQATGGRLFSIYDSSDNSRYCEAHRNGNGVSGHNNHTSGGTTLNYTSSATFTQTNLAAVRTQTNDIALYFNGVADGTDTSVTVDDVPNMLAIAGYTAGSNVGTCYIRKFAYYPRAMTNSELTTLTTSGLTSGNMLGTEVAGLALDFTSSSVGAYERDYEEYSSSPDKAAASLLTYTSPSPKLCLGPAGTYRYGAHNLHLYSNTFSNAIYVKSGVSIAAENISDPYGGTAAAHVLTTAAANPLNGMSVTSDAYNGLVSGFKYQITIRLKDNGANAFPWTEITTTNPTNRTWVNVATGAVGTTGHPSCTATSLGSGWYEYTVVTNLLTAASEIYCTPRSSNGDASSVTGDGVSGYYTTRWQVSRYPADTTYLATTTAARYALPLEWSSAGVAQGLLVEVARTNLALYSSQFDHATWTGAPYSSNSTITANSTTAPDGTTTADTLTATGATGRITQNIGAINNQSCTFSVFVKRKTGTGAVYLWTNIEEGTCQSSNLSGSINSSTWTRLSFTATTRIPGAGTAYPGVELATSGDEVYLWGAQFEVGAYSTSPIETFGSTVTRAKDQITIAASLFPYNASTGTLFGRAHGFTATGVVVTLEDSGDNGRLGQMNVSTNATDPDAVNAYSNATGQLSNESITVEAEFACAYAYALADHAFCVDGDSTPQTSATTTALATANRLAIGEYAGINQSRGYLKQIAYIPSRLTNAELITRTAA
jgi:hypothetical protein